MTQASTPRQAPCKHERGQFAIYVWSGGPNEGRCVDCYPRRRYVQGARPWMGLLYDTGRALRASAPELVAVVLAGLILAVYFTWCVR